MMKRVAAVKIQKQWRKHQKKRFENEECPISGVELCTLPQSLVYKLGFQEYDLLPLFFWMLKNPTDPMTREPVPQETIHEIYQKISKFYRADRVIKKTRKGHFRRKRHIYKAMRQYEKKYIGI
jgi:hypothetical protein